MTVREEFLQSFCDSCFQPTRHENCGQIFRSLLEPIRCPYILKETHEICSYCLDLYPKAWHHEERCAFAHQQIHLRAAGWSTPTSAYILRSLRRARFPYHKPLSNLLRVLLLDLHLEGALLIPIPMGSARRRDPWIEIVQAASIDMEGTEILTLLMRKKQRSTRRSVLQVRERIVQQEYTLDESAGLLINQRRVALIDDNVTTGTTMIRAIQLLAQHSPSEIIPVVIERQVSARLLQRCPSPSTLACPYYVCKVGDT
jgi:predicted amidophosphoribosyltransferase